MPLMVLYIWHEVKSNYHRDSPACEHRLIASSTLRSIRSSRGVDGTLRAFAAPGISICSGGTGPLRASRHSRTEERLYGEASGEFDCRCAASGPGRGQVNQRRRSRSLMGAPWRGEWTWPVRRTNERLSGTTSTTGWVVKSWRVLINCSFRIGSGLIHQQRSRIRG